MSGSRLLSSKHPTLQTETVYHYPSDSDAYHFSQPSSKLTQRRTKYHRNPNRFKAIGTTSHHLPVPTRHHHHHVHPHELNYHDFQQPSTHRRALRRNVKYAQRLKNKKIAGLTQFHNLHSLWISQLIKLDDPVEKHVHCVCHCKAYDFHGISKRFKDVHEIFYIFASYSDALHFRMRTDNKHNKRDLQTIVDDKDIFVFQNEGMIVSWNVSKAERNTFIRMLKPFRDEYPIEELSPGILPEADEFCYELGPDQFAVDNHTVTLSLRHCFDKNYVESWDDHIDEYVLDSKYVDTLQMELDDLYMEKKLDPVLDHEHEIDMEMDTDLDDVSVPVTIPASSELVDDVKVNWKAVRGILMMQKLAVSFGIAQSTKLTVFELRTDDNIGLNAAVSTQMAVKGSVGLKTKTIVKRMGRLFIARSELNLRSDVLDTPEHLYENDMFLSEFYRIREYLNIDKRLEVINARFRLMHQLYQIVMHQQETAHGSKLEWIVIW
eukprot:CAMPEP_0197027882 /NCGR_PEP_ID=MMETSP1384-20130603/7743_1 /TAXON_ID=29189 /ORGANISM="Ammonia sp." /LENGTH=490 /DNA_ID=CAMNT_0042456801 /DNA_START=15 /DNA_END=1484 /DNA_ORIENTATION=+